MSEAARSPDALNGEWETCRLAGDALSLRAVQRHSIECTKFPAD